MEDPPGEVFLIGCHLRATALFCAVARCVRCGERTIARETLRCACGQANGNKNGGRARLPRGMDWLLQQVISHYWRNSDRGPARGPSGRRRSADLETLYTLQKGRCYYCIKQLGAYSAPGAFVRDHLSPVLGFSYASSFAADTIDNIALTCHACNETKGRLDENAYWQLLGKKHGNRWVEKRQKAMNASREWRAARR